MKQAAPNSSTIETALEAGGARLMDAGVEAARRDARLLLAAALAVTPEVVMAFPERILSPQDTRTFERYIGRRAAREPVSRILGQREFWSLPFAIAPATLDPRPESECLIEAVLRGIEDPARPLKILDLGTGSGCLLLALLSELPEATGLGVDCDPAALEIATRNAVNLGLSDRATFRQGNWAVELSGFWQVIVSNPPYIKEDDLSCLAPEVRDFDPKLALDGGSDGRAAYRLLAPEAARLVSDDGFVAFELGADQADDVGVLLAHAGLATQSRHRDLAGRERCLLARRSSKGLAA